MKSQVFVVRSSLADAAREVGSETEASISVVSSSFGRDVIFSREVLNETASPNTPSVFFLLFLSALRCHSSRLN